MAYTHFSELKPGPGAQPIVARLLRFWEARNVKKGGEVMGVDMLLLDAKSSLMAGSVNVSLLDQFKPLFQEGTMYAINGFHVTRTNPNFKLCDSHISIRFTALTTIEVVPDTVCSIPMEMFRFRDHESLIALANTNTELPDIIGEVCTIKTVLNAHTQRPQRIMCQIRLSSGVTVCLSAFDNLAMALDGKLQATTTEPKVILATNINPKFVGGKLFLNATSGTHFYFDADVEASETYTKENPGDNTSTPVTQQRSVQKLETVTVGELNDFIVKHKPQAIDFLCTSKVTDIQNQKGWSYIACSKCSKKLLKGTSSLICTVCHNSNAVGIVRYRVELVVSDNRDSALFVAFDTDMTKLTNVRAADAWADGNEENETPQLIKDIVGNTYTFQLRLTEYNFTSKHRSFTISRIFEDPQLAPQPVFTEQVDAIVPAAPLPPIGEFQGNNNPLIEPTGLAKLPAPTGDVQVSNIPLFPPPPTPCATPSTTNMAACSSAERSSATAEDSNPRASKRPRKEKKE